MKKLGASCRCRQHEQQQQRRTGPALVAAFAILLLSSSSAIAADPTSVSAPSQGGNFNVRINGLDAPVIAVDPSEPFIVTWEIPASLKVKQVGYEMAIGKKVFSGVAASRSDYAIMPSFRAAANGSFPSATVPKNALSHGIHELSLSWIDEKGAVHASTPIEFHASDPDWSGSDYLGSAKRYRASFTLSSVPSDATLYIMGVGYYQLYINGVRVLPEVALAGSWTVYNARLLFDTINVAPYLKNGVNVVGVMLGKGWRDTSQFPPLSNKDPACDPNERVLRAVLEGNNGKQLLATTSQSWQQNNAGPVLDDSVYNGETFNNSLSSLDWTTPSFTPDASWTAAAALSNCFKATVLSAHAMPQITVQETHSPLSIKPFQQCPANNIGGVAAENSNLTLTCTSGSISSIAFASFGTPTGSCGSFNLSSCHATSSLNIVQSACVGKSTCTIAATDAVFGDPCYGTVKQLAVQGVGCEGPSSFVVDFGENLSGVVSIRATGPRGTAIVMEHAEVLMHEPYGPVNGDIYNGNLRSAKATDTLYLSGDPNGETYTPHFTYHGFRYVKVTGYPGNLTSGDITRLHFRSNLTLTTSFHSSSQVVNKIHYGAYRGQGSNLMSVPTDCDQRDERLGWMGDANLSAESFCTNYDCLAFFSMFIRSMVDAQDVTSGAIPDTTPHSHGGNIPADPSWSQAFPQNIYVQSVLANNLNPAKTYWNELFKYMGNLQSQLSAAGSMGNWKPSYGDWVPAGPDVSGQVCSSANYIIAATQMKELAHSLGDSANETYFSNLRDTLVADYVNSFYQPQYDCYDDCGQAALALSMVAGVVNNSDFKHMAQKIADDVDVRNNHVTVGIIGAKALFPMMSEGGQKTAAVNLIEQTAYPSWGYMFYNTIEPATSSIWELWDSPSQGPSMNSRNHHMFSSVSYWIVSDLGGMVETSCGASSFVLAPGFHQLQHTHAVRTTPCGKVEVEYRRDGGRQSLRTPLEPNAHLDSHATLTCGATGGTIVAITHASFGMENDQSCKSALDLAGRLNVLCKGKRECAIDLRQLPQQHCFGANARGHVPVLSAEFECSEPTTHHASITVPGGYDATVLLPSQDPGALVIENERGGIVEPRLPSEKPALTTYQQQRATSVSLGSGTHALHW